MTTGTAESADLRELRGRAIVESARDGIRHIVADTYFVPSQTTDGGYVVNTSAETCTCEDFETCRTRCKHVWAVLILLRGSTSADGAVPLKEKRPTYPQAWPAYNRAQVEEKEKVKILLRELCDGIVLPPQQMGRPRIPLDDMVYAAAMKVYTTLSGRRASTDIHDCEDRGLIAHMPSYNSIFRFMEDPAILPLLKTLVAASATPFRALEHQFAADSTGFATNTYSRWFDHKYGKEKRVHRWIKAHAMIGAVTNVITAIEVTEGTENDSPYLRPLLTTTHSNGFNMKEVSADKAYLSNLNLIEIESKGATPYIPFKSNSTPWNGTHTWTRLFHYFAANPEEFLRHYHMRSNVESTFSALKRKFGGSVRSKTVAAQYNEVLLKVLCFNLSMLVHAINEFAIDPKFWMPTREGEI